MLDEYLCIHLYEVSKIAKLLEAESEMVVVRALGWEKSEIIQWI